MLTPDQITLRLERLVDNHGSDACSGCLALVGVLHAILPELAKLASGHSFEDAGRRYRDRSLMDSD